MNEQFIGFHSTITQMPGHILEKRYGPKAHGFEYQHAHDIAHHIRTFTKIAHDIGIPVAPTIGHVIYDNGHKERVDLAEYVPNIGPTLLDAMKKQITSGNKKDALSNFQEYLRLFQRVWEADFPISLDPPLTNFCMDRDNHIWYVDCMPPRQRLHDGTYISEWPEPSVENEQFIIDRYFSPKQARVIYAQTLRNLLPLGFSGSEIKTTIADVLGPQAENVITMLPEERQRVLTDPVSTDVDFLRILASEACDQNRLSADRVKTVYSICHIGIGGILPSSLELRGACTLIQSV